MAPFLETSVSQEALQPNSNQRLHLDIAPFGVIKSQVPMKPPGLPRRERASNLSFFAWLAPTEFLSIFSVTFSPIGELSVTTETPRNPKTKVQAELQDRAQKTFINIWTRRY